MHCIDTMILANKALMVENKIPKVCNQRIIVLSGQKNSYFNKCIVQLCQDFIVIII